MNRIPASSFTDLIVWQKAHQFVLNVYKMSEAFPKSEMYGLTSQLRRASVSIAANIAEGFKKRGVKDKARFMNISQGSLEECQYYLILVQDLGFTETDALKADLTEVSKMLRAYRTKILNS
ncbi:MAG: four helix bundle protein [Balneolaceae bacterium]|nr:four helix bundle protein [Balneolaceae bacterium]